jgi:hypothetical protein
MASATLLLPAADRFGGQRVSTASARWLGRADRRPPPEPAGNLPYPAYRFDILPRGWPAAAVTRQRDAGDAEGATWLRADPVYVQPDINGARLMAHGDALALDAADAAALLPALKPVFGDAGFILDAPHPSRWYLRLPPDAKPPATSPPDEVLGADLFEHLPAGDAGRRWRSLLSETQVLLHNHPHNASRAAAGLSPVNSLWFWGAGRVPDHVRSRFETVLSDDDTFAAFGAAAGARTAALPATWSAGEGRQLVDLRHLRDLRQFDRDWLSPLLADLSAGAIDSADIDFADGRCLHLARRHRWRFWRKPVHSFVAPQARAGE